MATTLVQRRPHESLELEKETDDKLPWSFAQTVVTIDPLFVGLVHAKDNYG